MFFMLFMVNILFFLVTRTIELATVYDDSSFIIWKNIPVFAR